MNVKFVSQTRIFEKEVINIYEKMTGILGISDQTPEEMTLICIKVIYVHVFPEISQDRTEKHKKE